MAVAAPRSVSSAEATPATPTAATDKTRAALTCTVSSSCVNSVEMGGLPPLHFEGTPEQAIAALRTALAAFIEAKILTADDQSVEVVFTTDKGFRDLVDFRIDAAAQRIDFRSHSSFGRNDFGKNRERMTAFSAQFQESAKR